MDPVAERGRALRAIGAATALVLVLAAIAAGVTACSKPSYAESHAAAKTVDELLTLRRERSTDASDYARFFRQPELGAALASSSAEATAGPPVPKWKTPYVSKVGTQSATVVVVWQETATFREWPYATLFLTERDDGRWVVVDAEIVEREKLPDPVER